MKRLILLTLISLLCGYEMWGCGLRVAFVGDPQVDNQTELDYARKSIYRELRERKDLDLVIILGDIANDDTQWLAPSFATLDSLPCPWVSVPGNHDRNFYKKARSRYPGKELPQRPRDLQDYKKLNGYIDTSFVQQGVRFICMNNVRTLGTRDYEGGFNPQQKQWIDSLMQHTPSQKSVVFCTHIPMSNIAGLDSLSVLLKNHKKVYFVSGHTHSVLRHLVRFNPNEKSCPEAVPFEIEELIAGASCGTWWRGKKGADGVPYALMRSGDPRGYFVADFCGGKWQKLHYKTVGSTIQASLTRREGKIYINVYGGRQEARVQLRAKKAGSPWHSLERSEEICEEVRQVIEFNKTQAQRDEKMPMRKTRCKHLWILDEQLIPNEKVRLRYDDGLYKFEIEL